jgi:hypothetical protein
MFHQVRIDSNEVAGFFDHCQDIGLLQELLEKVNRRLLALGAPLNRGKGPKGAHTETAVPVQAPPI